MAYNNVIVLMLYCYVCSVQAEDGEEEQMTEEEFDESLLMGDDRKSLKSLSPEEAAEEVR